MSVLVALGVVALGLPLVGVAHGGFLAAVTNNGDTLATGSLQIAGVTSGGTTECATSIATASAPCTGYRLASNGLAAGTTAQSVTTTIRDLGSLTPTTTTLTQGTCGPIPLQDRRTAIDAQNSTDPMVIRGGVSDATAGVYADGAALTTDGTSGYADDVVATNNPTAFTETVWFKTTSTTGGNLIGFSNTPATGPSSWDRMLWVDNAGHVVFGVFALTTQELTSSGIYNDGKWHQATASVGPTLAGGLLGGQTLYVDGTQVGSNLNVTGGQSYSGYWHVGWDNSNSGWPDGPSNPYLNGSLTDAAIFPTLTAAQVTSLYNAGSQATWNSDVDGGNGFPAATHAWMLGDPPTNVYTGTPSWYSATPCALVDATVGVAAPGATCAAPSSGSACTAPTSAVRLSTLAATAVALPNPTPSQPDALTVTTARDGSATVAANPQLVGLHLNFAEVLLARSGSFTATLTWPATQNVVL